MHTVIKRIQLMQNKKNCPTDINYIVRLYSRYLKVLYHNSGGVGIGNIKIPSRRECLSPSIAGQ